MFSIGYKRRLEEDDMYDVLPEDGSERLGLELTRYRMLQCRMGNIQMKPNMSILVLGTYHMAVCTKRD